MSKEESNKLNKKIEKIEQKLKESEQVSTIQVGDLVVSTNKGSLKDCKRVAKDIVKDKELNDYLTSFLKKKVASTSFVG